jgi:ubiquinone/menaquinone biosynthesis C-methylase UbiE
MRTVYDEIGAGYSTGRQPDPRITALISRALGTAHTVLNVGAGAGSYEPSGRGVVALEPSSTMIRQRSPGSGPSVQAVAEYLPFQDNAFDSVMAILTIHHWTDPFAGISEMKRVARDRVVILTWDQEVWDQFWLVTEYLPALGEFIRDRAVAISAVQSALGSCQVIPVLIPNDCADGFLGAFWSRPSAYLDREIRA